MAATQVQLGDMAVDVVFKNIQNVHLSVHPPTGRVTISAPTRMNLDTVRVFAISKLAWIRQRQRKFQAQERETPREMLSRESHYVWGRRYLLKIIEADRPAGVEASLRQLLLCVRPGADRAKRQAVLDEWYRQQVRDALPPLAAKWEPLVGRKAQRFFVQRMKTRWGSCNPCARTIRLNTALAKKPRGCLEYVLVHEMVHFLEPTHNQHFLALMDQFMPHWRSCRQELNRLPVRHENWAY